MVIGLGLKFKSWPSRILYPKHYHSLLSADRNLISLLKSCKQASETSQIHGLLVKSGLDLVPFTLSKLLASSVLVSIDHAASIFKHIQNPSLFMFNTMLRGYSICDDPEKAFLLYNYMRAQNILLDQFSFVSTLKSCSRLCATWKGQGIHSVVVRSGHDLFVNVNNALLHFYCVCGEIGDTRQMFDEFPQRDLVSWNTLMGGYLHASQPSVVIDLFRQLHRDTMRIGACTILSALSAVGHVGNILGGESFHGYCIKTGFCLDLNVATAMIAMYGKIGLIDSGRRIFNEVPAKDIVLWNCLIDGYAKSGLLEESLALLQTLKLEQLKPNSSTLAGLLSACAASGALAVGQSIHNYVDVEQPGLDAVLGTALVDMYCKSGMLDKAIEVFDRIESKDVKSWTAMISGFGMHGQAKNAIAFFQRMKEEGHRPNEVTFLAVLSACSHAGLVKEGMSCFESMVQDYGFTPKAEHYGCIVDLLGRAGLLEEAYKLIEGLTIEADATAWRTLLAACRVHGNVSLGKHVKKLLENIFEEHPADSIVLLSTCAIAGRLPDNVSMQEIKEGRIGKSSESMLIELKEAGCSSIEVENQR
ncbi:pentatricopeptide repeat-containing protein At1g26900, mitochondrial [Diospyros lotus]|uniref:pentatricopeptide repeat-containing protein At1g26900, mitochondrial n=1 Tax=Diospyros lotus TaxID=55363 RepID=UPI00225348BD|nr:pentatricopeptide repeat-containing protein At1g26900, mitochondrial [Diospyros lotus]